jgi:pimeloyl-ACP methyl ester carboxylesterase
VSVEYADAGNGIRIAYEEFGDPANPPLLLVMGLGTQMLGWREGFCRALAGEGLRVIRFDNRDAGLSTHLDGMPDLAAVMRGDTSSARYRLEDMAADTAGLLDALGLESAHVVGASMGGMIAQMLAAGWPDRVRSLTSIMSTTGEAAVSQPTPEAMAVLTQRAPRNVDEAGDRAVAAYRVIGSPGFEFDEEEVRALGRTSYERAHDPPGFARQLAAIWASGDRTEAVRRITAPTLVIHGVQDPLVQIAGGRATAAAIDGSELVEFDGMGHDLPRALWPQIVDAIAGHARRADSARAAAA